MANTFALLFLAPGPNDLPGRPISHVYVESFSRQSYRGKNPNLVLITPQAVSDRELGGHIDALCEERQEIN